LSKDYFNSIEELPIWNWWKISETSNFIYLHKESDYKESDNSLSELWQDLNDEYFNEYGINDKLRKIMTLKKKWIDKKEKYLVKGDRFALTEIDIIEADLRDLEATTETMKNKDTVIYLEQKLGREINPKTTSVKKYYDYIEFFSKEK
jgi:hypothetical protein